MKRYGMWMWVVWVLVSLLVVGPVAAAPENPPAAGRENPLMGVVVQVNANSVSLKVRPGEVVTATVTSDTVLVVPDVAQPTLNDFKKGDRVLVFPAAGANKLTARLLARVPDNSALLNGKVTVLSGNEIQIQPQVGAAVKIAVDNVTRILGPETKGMTVADLKVGDRLTIFGEWQGTATFHAWAIRVAMRLRTVRFQGQVLELGKDSFTLGTFRGVVQVKVNSETNYEGGDGFATLKVNQRVVVAGSLQEDQSVLAEQIKITGKGG